MATISVIQHIITTTKIRAHYFSFMVNQYKYYKIHSSSHLSDCQVLYL